MTIEQAVRKMHAVPEGWVRLDGITRVRCGLDLQFGVYNGRKGGKIENLLVKCTGVRDVLIEDFDGGGIRLYARKHAAAQQFGEQAEIRWYPHLRLTAMMGELYQAHNQVAEDWIPFRRYSKLRQPGPPPYVCRGPKFLMTAYAKALKGAGEEPVMRVVKRNRVTPLKVLHFGESYVVAERFSV